MNFIYEKAIIPKKSDLLTDINSAAKRLHSKLSTLDLNSLNISEYNMKYFGDKLKNLKYSLQFSAYILAWALKDSKVSYNNFFFLEYGAGSGLTSLLASEFGLNVIYNDIYEISTNDAKVIANALGNEALYYVTGDLDYTIDFLKSHHVDCNTVVSRDVIEHIYDINSFFRKLPMLGKQSLSVVMCSGANQFHPYVKRQMIKKQIQSEFIDRKKEYGHKERDSLKAYRKIRQEIISTYLIKNNHKLTHDEIMNLVKTTRGMNFTDIHSTIKHYLISHELPSPLQHPTNTCDPLTGSWCEKLMNPYELAKILIDSDFKASVYPGYYGNISGFTKRTIGKFLDMIISSNILYRKSLAFAPFYTIYAKKN